MKRNSQQYVEQAAGHAAGVRLTARHTAGGDAAGHAASAYPPHTASAYAPPRSYAVGGKENSTRAAPGSKAAPPQSPRYGGSLAPPRSPRYGSSLGSNLAATSQQPPPHGHGSNPNHHNLNHHDLAARRAAPPSGAPPSGFLSERGGRTGPCETAPDIWPAGRHACMRAAHDRLAGRGGPRLVGRGGPRLAEAWIDRPIGS